MRKLNATHIVVALAVLVNVVWMIDEWSPSASRTESVELKVEQKAVLIKNYDQYPFDFSIDFDGDSFPDRLFVEQRNEREPHELVVQDKNAHDMLRLPCEDEDNVIHGNSAVYRYKGKTRLLVYDTLLYGSSEMQVFGWNHQTDSMTLLNPLSSDEQSAVRAMMGAHKINPTSRLSNDFLWLRRGFYVFSLVILFAIYRYQKSSGTGGFSSLP